MKTPIYIDEHKISPNNPKVEDLERAIGRPIIFIKGNPHEAVLDSHVSLRDDFAGRAMQGELAAQNIEEVWLEKDFEKLAERSYKLADAMLAAKDKK